MIAIALASLALAGPPEGFDVTKEDVSGCTLMLGEADDRGDVAMRAECVWSDVETGTFDEHVRQWDLHDDIFSSVETSDVLSTDGDVTTVRQIHVSKGISDRELVIDGRREELDDGGFRYRWTKSDHRITIGSGRVEAARSDGVWEVHPREEGGVTVIHQLSYDPAGRVPGFLVRWFQTSGLSAIVTDLHEYLQAKG